MHAAPMLKWLLACVNWRPRIPPHRSPCSSMKRDCIRGWEGTSQRARSTGFGRPTTFPWTARDQPGFCPSGQRGDGRYSALAAAELLNVNVSTIADWCNAGRLECVRAGTHGPRWITLTPETIAELRKSVQRHWKRRGSRQHEQNMVQ